MLPNFLICGALKSGTSALCSFLKLHPDIFLAEEKELDFFIKNYRKGISWYQKYFSGWQGQKAVGEATAYYMEWEGTARRIAAAIPKAKLIFILRNPIDRLYSDYWYFGKSGVVNLGESFSRYIRKNPGKVKSGFYYRQIKRFLPYFSRNNMHFIITEEFKTEPLKELKKCFAFFEVDPDYDLPLNKIRKQHNVTKYPHSIGMAKILFKIFWPLKKASPFFYSIIFPKKIRRFSEKFIFSQKRKPPIKEKDRSYLREVYRQSNRHLEEFLGRDLSFWK